MEVDEIHRKFPRTANGKLGHKMDEEDDGEKSGKRAAAAAAADLGGGLGRFYGWPSSRIVRVSRASGGKDRHSKVLTSKGLRDRRVRLSVNTAIQFYDLQDRLGYDQPSKAVEWLLKAAAASIAELPPITTPFPETPRQVSDEKRSSSVDHLCFDSADPNKFSQPAAAPPPQAVCSSTSETSKGSGLSLSRSESRIKARERAKGRVLAERGEKESECCNVSMNPISQTTSFTELLNGGIINGNNRQWSSSTPPMDYFAGNPFTFGNHQNFSFLSDLGNHHHHHHNNNNNQNNGEYNLNFTISSSSAENPSGFNRGTLQSNSAPPQLPHFQRYDNNNNNNDNNSSNNNNNNNPDGSTQGFYIGHHQFQSGYDSRLQLCYGGDGHGNTTGTNNDNNGSRPSKGRN